MTTLNNVPSSLPMYLPVDLTGSAADNLITNEMHTIQGGQVSTLKCDYGPFYTNNFSIEYQDGDGNLQPMTHGVDYVYAEFDAQSCSKTGLDVYKTILILNVNLPGVYSVTYQAYGGSDNANLSLIYQQASSPASDTSAVDFNTVQQTPPSYPPVTHQHDVEDYYGLEYLVNYVGDMASFVRDKFTVFPGLPVNSATAQLYSKVTYFTNTLNNDNALLSIAISQHLGNQGYAHAYTAAMIGLGNVQDGGFVALNDTQGSPLPIYAHPLSVAQAITNKPAASDYTSHYNNTANPHDVTRSQVGLGNLSNFTLLNAYVSGGHAYSTVLDPTQTQQYITPYVVVNAATEAQAAQVQLNWTTPIAPVTDPVSGSLVQANNQIALAQEAITAADTAISAAMQTLASINSSIDQAQSANNQFSVVNYNAPYAALLSAILAYDYSNTGNGSQTAPDGYYAVPSMLDSLYLWLDVNYSKNNYQTDSSGKTYLMGMTDRSSYGRLFVSNSIATAPQFTQSQDIVQGKVGISVGQVALFGPGTHMDQIAGPPVALQPGMTIIALVRTQAPTTPFVLLSDVSSSSQANIIVQPQPTVALGVNTLNWTPLQAAPGTIVDNTSTIIAACISQYSENNSWLATCQPRPSAYPRGVNTPPTTWPGSFMQTIPLTRIGNANAQSANGAELIELIVFNRQLSFAEVQCVIDYLRLAKSHDLAFTMDMSASQAF